MTILIGPAHKLRVSPPEVMEFYKNNWERQIALTDREFYKWQFCDLPSGGGLDSCHVAYDDFSKSIIGVIGLNERFFYADGKKLEGAELTTWIVNKDFQGSGVGAKILMNLQKNYDVLVGMNISQMALSTYLLSGFRFQRLIQRFFRIYDLAKIEEFSEVTPLGRKLVHRWKEQSEVAFLDSDPTDDDLEYVNRVMITERNYFIRDAEHLKWRYLNHPYFHYNLKIIQSPTNLDKKLLVIYRFEETEIGIRVLHILDLIGDIENVPNAISYINHISRLKEVHLADFYCTYQPILDFFIPNGWFSTVDDESIRVPNLFQPLEMRHPQTSSLVYWGSQLGKEIFKKSLLYVTKGDCDLDRPTEYYLDIIKHTRTV